ncbi:MAG: lipoyl(octanoyl) transferase LipB [Candidatus Omnitrophica bacterium]|nr:lipoyl(octanoyl) transferase LipB [Candidatus Omnitrophota bacterium]
MKVIDLGLTDFLEVYKLQLEMVNAVASGLSENILLITEHKPVITIGRKGSESNILRNREYLSHAGIDVINVDRGGDVTYHGPGQIVAYPIFRLENESRDIHNFLDFLEDVGGYFLEQYGLYAEKKPGLRGIWIEDRKIGSIGIGARKWVTYHGMAINIDPDLLFFSFIRPCGLDSVKITSLRKELCRELDISDAKNKLVRAFKEIPLLAEAAGKAG